MRTALLQNPHEGFAVEGHDVCFYDRVFPAQSVAAFLSPHLDAGAALIVASREHLGQVLAALAEGGRDVAAARARGQLLCFEGEDVLAEFDADGQFDFTRFEGFASNLLRDTHARFPVLGMYGELVNLLCQREREPDALRLELWWDGFCAQRPFPLLCGYDYANFERPGSSAHFSQLCAAHARVHPGRREAESSPKDVGRLVALAEQRSRALEAALEQSRRLSAEQAELCAVAQEARAQADAANRAKDEFLAMLGHELRNPLSPMLTALHLMQLRAGDVCLKERSVLERQVRHMARLVDDLLDVSRITRGTLELSRRQVELAEVVERAVEVASPLLEQRAHRLEVDVPPLGTQVHVDADRLAQALTNLLVNAAKYTPKGGVIEVWTARRDDRVQLCVRDNGAGIEIALMPQIFDAFIQGSQALDRACGGLGLGLPIARKLVELHGGSLSAQSPGRGLGSTFVIELPLACEQAASAPSGAHERCPLMRAHLHPGALRVLVVDDNEDAARTLSDVLSELGHDVRVALDGPEALALVSTFHPDLALLDIGLPAMDGFELAEHLTRRLASRPPLMIAVTGYGQASDIQRAREAGFAQHFVKPVDLERLRATLDSLRASCAGPSSLAG